MRKSLSNAGLAANVVEFLCSKHMLIIRPSANQILYDPGKNQWPILGEQRGDMFSDVSQARTQRRSSACSWLV
jgi:hypothetical protein